MGGLVYTETSSGLVLAQHREDGAAVARALQQYDPALQLRLDEQGVYWKVYRHAGGDRPAEFVCAWMDEATREPYPLSFALLDMVKRQDRNTPIPAPDPDLTNARKKVEAAKQERRDFEAMIDDWLPRERRSAMLPRGQGLRRVRDKARARGEKI